MYLPEDYKGNIIPLLRMFHEGDIITIIWFRYSEKFTFIAMYTILILNEENILIHLIGR